MKTYSSNYRGTDFTVTIPTEEDNTTKVQIYTQRDNFHTIRTANNKEAALELVWGLMNQQDRQEFYNRHKAIW